MIVLNVSTLAKRLDTLLSWQAHIFALSEVRLSLSSQRSVARRASALGFSALFSPPPPVRWFCGAPWGGGSSGEATSVDQTAGLSRAS